MYKPNCTLERLRSSQKFLAKEDPPKRHFKFCCWDDEEITGEDLLAPALSASPQPKISIKKLKRQSPHAWNHTNSDFSISKHSQRSNLPSKKTTQTHIPPCPHCVAEHHMPSQQNPHHANITFLYSNAVPQNKINHYNSKSSLPPEQKIQAPLPQKNPAKQPMPINYNLPIKAKQIDQSIEKEFKNILDFGENREELVYGEAFPLEKQDHPPKVKTSSQGMPNFSFGQNQKEQFMSKYLNVKQEASIERAIPSSKENSKQSEMMKEIIEQRLSKSSKSSGRLFVRGTFNKHNINPLVQKRQFMYKSESQISLESSQSLVLQSYQNIMRKRESFIRDCQY